MELKKSDIRSLGYQSIGMHSGLDFGIVKPHQVIAYIDGLKETFTIDSLVIGLSNMKNKKDQPRNKGIDFIIREARKLSNITVNPRPI